MGTTCTKPRAAAVLVPYYTVANAITGNIAELPPDVRIDKENHQLPNGFTRTRRGSVGKPLAFNRNRTHDLKWLQHKQTTCADSSTFHIHTCFKLGSKNALLNKFVPCLIDSVDLRQQGQSNIFRSAGST